MNKTILVVEDHADGRAMMKYLLEGYGYRVLEACDGLEAIESVKRELPHLILMDISMPHMDGLTATREIRGIEGCADLPIIAVTAHGQAYYRQAIEAGCNEFINKPVEFERLEPILKQYLS